MKHHFSLLCAAFVLHTFSAFSQTGKVITDCTITYNLTVENANSSPELIKSLNGATKTVYIKGTKSRTDLVSPSHTLTIINDTKVDTTVILREIGNTRYMTFLDEKKKIEKNRKYEGITFTPSGETKVILGYECKKVVAKLSDGAAYNVFYAPALVPSNREYEYQFKDLQGLALEYETQSDDGKMKYKFTAVKIVLTPVVAAKFDLPKSGYRIL